VLPYRYYVRSFIYCVFINVKWDPCIENVVNSPVCVDSTSGKDVLQALSRVFAVVEAEDTMWNDVGILLAMAIIWKILKVVIAMMKLSKVASFINEHVSHLKRSTTPKKSTLSVPSASMEDIDTTQISASVDKIVTSEDLEFTA
jgi:hypothetical protein